MKGQPAGKKKELSMQKSNIKYHVMAHIMAHSYYPSTSPSLTTIRIAAAPTHTHNNPAMANLHVRLPGWNNSAVQVLSTHTHTCALTCIMHDARMHLRIHHVRASVAAITPLQQELSDSAPEPCCWCPCGSGHHARVNGQSPHGHGLHRGSPQNQGQGSGSQRRGS